MVFPFFIFTSSVKSTKWNYFSDAVFFFFNLRTFYLVIAIPIYLLFFIMFIFTCKLICIFNNSFLKILSANDILLLFLKLFLITEFLPDYVSHLLFFYKFSNFSLNATYCVLHFLFLNSSKHHWNLFWINSFIL